MATLNEVMKETADAIREKKGKSELIAPVNFAEEIKGITSGGSSEGGESGVEYVVQTMSTPSALASSLWERATLVKVKFESFVMIDSPMSIYNMFTIDGIEFNTSYIEAMCIDFKAKIVAIGPDGAKDFTIEEYLGVDKNYFASITKEQFYDLNA